MRSVNEELAENPTSLRNALSLTNTSTGNTDAYAAGYMFLRYLAKQASDNNGDDINYIYNSNSNSLVSGSSGVDSIYNSGKYSTISAGDGNDTINNQSSGDYSSLNGGSGNDSINAGSNSYSVTLNGGYGNDTLIGSTSYYGDVFQFGNRDDYDVITNYATNDTIHLTNTYFLSTRNYYSVGNDRVISLASDGIITVKGGANLNIKVKLANGNITTIPSIPPINDTITNYNDYSIVGGNNNSNKMINYGKYATLNGQGSNDTIYNYAGGAVINGDSGNDYLYNDIKKAYTIGSSYQYVTVSGGDGDDTIYSNDNRVSLSGGAGNDSIYTRSSWSGVTINGGTGNDVLIGTGGTNSLKGTLFQYTNGDGNDTITNIGSYDTITISGSTWSTVRSSSDMKVNIGNGSILLKGAANKNVKINPSSTPDVSIPSNAFTYNGHSYYIYSNVVTTWEDAKAYCEARGGHLAVINNSSENTALYNYMTLSGYTTAYFGLTDSATEGSWKWVNGDTSTYRNWAINEPSNDGNNEDYAQFYWKYTNGKWNDGNFGNGTESDRKTFICEWDTITSSSNYYYTTYNYQYLTASSSADSIYNNYKYVTISAGYGNDTIDNSSAGDYSSLSGGSGNDSINAGYISYRVTLNGGSGSDTLTGSNSTSYGDIFQFGSNDGYDVITNYGINDTIHLTGTYSASSIYTSISSSNSSDRIIRAGSTYITLQGAANKDINVNYGYGYSTILPALGTSSINYVYNYSADTVVSGVSGKDYIYNSGNRATIYAYSGDDTINNYGSYAKIYAGDGNDSIYNSYSYSTIDAGYGNDTIYNSGDYSCLNGGNGNDSLNASYTYNVTLNGGYGNDTLTGSYSTYYGDVFQFGNYDDYNVITNYGTNDTVHLTGTYSASSIYTSISSSNSNDGVMRAGSTYITLQGAASKEVKVRLADGTMTTVSFGSSNPINYIYNYSADTVVSGASGKDYIYNSGNRATIYSYSGDDTINNNDGNYGKINTGDGNDSIYNYDGDGVTIDAGYGNDTIYNNYSYNTSIYGGSGNDSIYNSGSSGVTIKGGYGNDTLSNSSSYAVVFQFGNRDDYDVITNYGTNDTIHLTNTYSLSASNYYNVGNDRVISLASDGVITVKGGASKNINIKLANGSMSTIYSSTSSYEERNFVEDHWFTAEDKVVEASDIETILQPTTTNDFSVEDIEFKDINNIFTPSINTTQLKKTNKK